MNNKPEQSIRFSGPVMHQVREAAEHHMVFEFQGHPASDTDAAIAALMIDPMPDAEFAYHLTLEQAKLARYLLLYKGSKVVVGLQSAIHDERVHGEAADTIVAEWDEYLFEEGLGLRMMAAAMRTVIGRDDSPAVFGTEPLRARDVYDT